MDWKSNYPKNNRYYETENGILYKGNSSEILAEFGRDSVQTIITSPPYNKVGFTKRKRKISKSDKFKANVISDGYEIDTETAFKDDLSEKDYQDIQIHLLNEFNRIIKSNGSIFYNHKDRRHKGKISNPLEWILKSDLNLYQTIIWDRISTFENNEIYLYPVFEYIYWLTKNNNEIIYPKVNKYKLKNEFQKNIWKILPERNSKHPAPFPTQIPENCILISSDKDDIILDPFVGSGTTIFTAEKHNRKWIGIDISDIYLDMSIKRLETLSILDNEWE